MDETPIEPPALPEATPNPEATPTDPTIPLRRMLETLVPEAGKQIEFEDVLGNRYRSPSVASLRVQAQLLDILKKNSALIRMDDIAATLLSALAAPELLNDLCSAMELLHPKAVKAAVAVVREENADETCSTADAFSGEAILGAVLPFFAGPILKILDLLATSGTLRS